MTLKSAMLAPSYSMFFVVLQENRTRADCGR